MSSRQEEKERRRQEREERERAAAAKAKRARLLQLIGGVVVACAIVVGVVFAISDGGGDDSDASGGSSSLKQAAAAAGCVYRSFPEEGRDHVDTKLTKADFKTNPPTSGAHDPTPADDGLYAPGNEPEIANWVHTLEHGRVLLQYRPGVDEDVVNALRELFNEDVKGSGGAYHSVLMRNNTDMPFEVAAVSWQNYLGCEKFTPKAIDAMRKFRAERVDKAPELIP